jgi:hypothetical protein
MLQTAEVMSPYPRFTLDVPVSCHICPSLFVGDKGSVNLASCVNERVGTNSLPLSLTQLQAEMAL